MYTIILGIKTTYFVVQSHFLIGTLVPFCVLILENYLVTDLVAENSFLLVVRNRVIDDSLNLLSCCHDVYWYHSFAKKMTFWRNPLPLSRGKDC